MFQLYLLLTDVTNFIEKEFSLIWLIWTVEKLLVASICQPQFQNVSRESWKLCLNLCSCKWLSPTRYLVSSSVLWGLCALSSTSIIEIGLINLRICFLKALTNSEFRIWLLSLLHSITVDGKKDFQKYSCLTLNKRMLFWILVILVDKFQSCKAQFKTICLRFQKQMWNIFFREGTGCALFYLNWINFHSWVIWDVNSLVTSQLV